MMERASLPTRDPRFDNFLFATVGEDRNGMQVSVLSALARVGVDPWQEAEELVRLSEEVARERLDTLISGLTEVPSLNHDHQKTAAHLIALLPRLGRFRVPVDSPAAADDAAADKRKFLTAVYIILMLVGQVYFLAQAPSSQVDGTGAPTFGSTSATK
jgi:hypothetical protein